jgi:predicted nicotinamide N-methyase
MPFSMKHFQHDYDTEIFPLKIGNHELHFLKPKTIDRFIDTHNFMIGFPLWAKFWEASAVLTQYMLDLPVEKNRRILELGSGLGATGIAAASSGHAITLTEYNSDALNFLHANARLNACGKVEIRYLDWFQPELEGSFDLIIGSEIIYQERVVEALEALFQKYLVPGGRVVLAERVRSTGTLFFERMSSRFDIRARKHTLRSENKVATVVLFEMSCKQPEPFR